MAGSANDFIDLGMDQLVLEHVLKVSEWKVDLIPEIEVE